MTIFDAIRYPVSDRVTYDELRNIPEPIIEKWLISADASQLYLYGPRQNVRGYMSLSDRIRITPAYAKEAVALLRKIIAEYED